MSQPALGCSEASALAALALRHAGTSSKVTAIRRPSTPARAQHCNRAAKPRAAGIRGSCCAGMGSISEPACTRCRYTAA